MSGGIKNSMVEHQNILVGPIDEAAKLCAQKYGAFNGHCGRSVSKGIREAKIVALTVPLVVSFFTYIEPH